MILKASESDLKDFENVCSKENMVISEEFKRKVLEKDELKQILDIEVLIQNLIKYIYTKNISGFNCFKS